MRRLAPKVLAVAIGFLLGSVTAVSAGVVMSETAIASGFNGNEMVHRTIYVQGNKQKVDTQNVQTITDLDKHLLYVVDKDHRNFVELPLNSMGNAPADFSAPAGAAVVLKRTGDTQVVAAHSCDEYRGRAAKDLLQITVSACVSMSAPGAAEIARFDRRMISQIGGQKSGTSQQSAGVVLQKKSVVNLRVSDPAQQRYRTASLTTKTTVNSIKLRPLPAQTFAPPKGYTQVEKPPAELPDGVESVMMLLQPLHQRRVLIWQQSRA